MIMKGKALFLTDCFSPCPHPRPFFFLKKKGKKKSNPILCLGLGCLQQAMCNPSLLTLVCFALMKRSHINVIYSIINQHLLLDAEKKQIPNPTRQEENLTKKTKNKPTNFSLSLSFLKRIATISSVRVCMNESAFGSFASSFSFAKEVKHSIIYAMIYRIL